MVVFTEVLQTLPKIQVTVSLYLGKNAGESLGINWLILDIYCVQPAVRVPMGYGFLRRICICFNCEYPNNMLSKVREISLVKYCIDRFLCSFSVATGFGTHNAMY